eukprot:3308202-Rhodomonas_salina.1
MALCQLAPPSPAAEVPCPEFLRLEYTHNDAYHGPSSVCVLNLEDYQTAKTICSELIPSLYFVIREEVFPCQ